jgi:hypothetical protein
VRILIVQSGQKVTHPIRDIIVTLYDVWNFDSNERLNCDFPSSTLDAGGFKCRGGT